MAIVSSYMIYQVAPKHGTKNPIVYLTICSLVGSISVMAIKAFGIALKLTLAGNNQLTHASTYIFGIVVVFCIMIQMNYFNKALDTFSTNVVNPIYFVFFTTSTIIASAILFQGFNTTDGTNTVSLLCGFLIIFMGVYLLNVSREPEKPHPHTALDSGVMSEFLAPPLFFAATYMFYVCSSLSCLALGSLPLQTHECPCLVESRSTRVTATSGGWAATTTLNRHYTAPTVHLFQQRTVVDPTSIVLRIRHCSMHLKRRKASG